MGVELKTSPEKALGVVPAPPELEGPRGSRAICSRGSSWRPSGWRSRRRASGRPICVSGTDQERVPLAAILDWFYATLATGLVLMAFGRRSPGASRSLWLGFTVAIGGIWFVVAVASIFAPSIETGTDPTAYPIADLGEPAGG